MGCDAAYRSIIYNPVVLKQNEMPTGAPEEERLTFLPSIKSSSIPHTLGEVIACRLYAVMMFLYFQADAPVIDGCVYESFLSHINHLPV